MKKVTCSLLFWLTIFSRSVFAEPIFLSFGSDPSRPVRVDKGSLLRMLDERGYLYVQIFGKWEKDGNDGSTLEKALWIDGDAHLFRKYVLPIITTGKVPRFESSKKRDKEINTIRLCKNLGLPGVLQHLEKDYFKKKYGAQLGLYSDGPKLTPEQIKINAMKILLNALNQQIAGKDRLYVFREVYQQKILPITAKIPATGLRNGPYTLLEGDVNLALDGTKGTPLLAFAAHTDQSDLTALLLALGADPEAKADYGSAYPEVDGVTALRGAGSLTKDLVSNDVAKRELLRKLLEATKTGQTSVVQEIFGSEEYQKLGLMIDFRFPVNESGNFTGPVDGSKGSPLLSYAIEAKQVELVRFLLDYGADPEVVSLYQGAENNRSPLEWAKLASSERIVAEIQDAIQKKRRHASDGKEAKGVGETQTGTVPKASPMSLDAEAEIDG